MSRLILVPTPIGNLDDITLRALQALRDADVVAAEDTRRSAVLLRHHGVATPLTRLDAHTAAARGPALLHEHETVAYVSDAGSPGISDPGAELVRIALAGDHQVEALPGPTAFVPALVLSGLPTARFAYEGFLPRKGGAREQRIRDLAAREHPTVLYESPRRLAATLHDLAGACGAERLASVSRELSKRFEETVRAPLGDLARRFEARPARGEIVVVVGPAPARGQGGADEHAATATALAAAGVRGRTLREALQALGVPRNDAYRLALDDPGAAREGDA